MTWCGPVCISFRIFASQGSLHRSKLQRAWGVDIQLCDCTGMLPIHRVHRINSLRFMSVMWMSKNMQHLRFEGCAEAKDILWQTDDYGALADSKDCRCGTLKADEADAGHCHEQSLGDWVKHNSLISVVSLCMQSTGTHAQLLLQLTPRFTFLLYVGPCPALHWMHAMTRQII